MKSELLVFHGVDKILKGDEIMGKTQLGVIIVLTIVWLGIGYLVIEKIKVEHVRKDEMVGMFGETK